MGIADVPTPWWAVDRSGPNPRLASGQPLGNYRDGGESTQEREAAYHRMKLARAERALPARPVAPRRTMTAEQRRAYLRKIGVIR